MSLIRSFFQSGNSSNLGVWNGIPLHITSYFVNFVDSKLFEYIHEVVWTKLVKNMHVIHINIISKTCIAKSACHKLIHSIVPSTYCRKVICEERAIVLTLIGNLEHDCIVPQLNNCFENKIQLSFQDLANIFRTFYSFWTKLACFL